ncbi:MAG: hypothetical protein ABL860_08385 [Candidatus Nitrotoga sp.]
MKTLIKSIRMKEIQSAGRAATVMYFDLHEGFERHAMQQLASLGT